MKIAIIGGGWVGCHLAYKLKNSHDITIFEKNNELFKESSFNNQNRLHLGFHYARNFKTRNLCEMTFPKFMEDYGFLTKEVNKNLYCVPKTKSIIDYQTYLQIFRENEKVEVSTNFQDVEGCLNTNERYIDFSSAHDFFNKELKHFISHEKVSIKKLKSISKNYDLVINCTNNHIKDESKDSFYELTISLLYEKIKDTSFDALTMVDGEFFSIYPYKDNKYTVTDVTHTPLKKFRSINKLEQFNITQDILNKKQKLIEKKITHYYPEFLSSFEYDGYFISTKSKFISTSDERYPVITTENNIVNVFTGKIQGIYIVEDYIKNLLKVL